MPSNKAIRRYRVLNRCLRDVTREYTLLDLLDEVNKDQCELADPHPVSERQLYADIAYMKSVDGLNADIDTFKVVRPDERGHNRSYMAYRYHDPSFSIDNTPLTDKQLSYINSALDSLSLISGIPQVAWLQQSLFGSQQLFEHGRHPFVQFGGNPFYGGTRVDELFKLFEQVFTAVTNKQSIRIGYRCFVKGDCEYNFHPFYFKQYHGFWYVFGVTTEEPDRIQPLAIDRIRSVSPCRDKYVHVDFDPNSYFEDIVGVVDTPEPPVDVHLHIYGWASDYIVNCPLHGSQRSSWIEVDGERVLDVWLKVKLNLELQGDLQYYMDCVKVLEPEKLRVEHTRRIRSAMALNGLDCQ